MENDGWSGTASAPASSRLRAARVIASVTMMIAPALAPIACAGSDPSYQGVPRDQPPLSAPPNTWTWIDVPDSRCDDGSPTGFAVNPKDTSDLFIFFEGGGACWDYLTCVAVQTATKGPVGAAEWAVRAANLPAQFDRTRGSNPFRDATMIYIPYCTGDLHAGDNVAVYSSVTTVSYYHKGRPDTVSFLSRVASTWRDPDRVVVSGSSAGGYGAELTYDLARKTFPQSRMYLIDDAGPLLEGDAVPAAERTAWISAWNIGGLIDDMCVGCRDDFSRLNSVLTNRYPNDRMALLSSLQDVTIRTYFMLTPDQFQTDLLQMIGDRLTPSLAFRSFVITGDQHTLLSTMTTSTTNGVILEPWLDDMVNDRGNWVSVLPAP
jgi:Pectinacetylesterase